MNESPTVRRALTFVVPVLLIAALSWYLVVAERGDGKARAAYTEPLQSAALPSWPPAGPYHALASGAEQVELCGYGPVPLDAVPADLEASAEAVVRHRAEALQRSASASERMLGFATVAMLAWSQAYVRAQQADPGCATRHACMDQARLDAARASVGSAEALARLAVTSRDPSIYATALAACRLASMSPEINVCSALRAEQWALLDPDNGQAWLEVARVAVQRKDTRSLDEAMQRAARGRSMAYPMPPFHELFGGRPPPSDAIEALAQQRVLDVYGRWLAPLADRSVVQMYCAREAIAEPARKALCGELAAALAERDGTLAGMLAGVGIGDVAGWSAERVASLRARVRALNDALGSHLPGSDLLTCAGAERAKAWLADVQRAGGETAYARRVLAGTDTTQARR